MGSGEYMRNSMINEDFNNLEIRVMNLERAINNDREEVKGIRDMVIKHDVKLNIIAFVAGVAATASISTAILLLHL